MFCYLKDLNMYWNFEEKNTQTNAKYTVEVRSSRKYQSENIIVLVSRSWQKKGGKLYCCKNMKNLLRLLVNAHVFMIIVLMIIYDNFLAFSFSIESICFLQIQCQLSLVNSGYHSLALVIARSLALIIAHYRLLALSENRA